MYRITLRPNQEFGYPHQERWWGSRQRGYSRRCGWMSCLQDGHSHPVFPVSVALSVSSVATLPQSASLRFCCSLVERFSETHSFIVLLFLIPTAVARTPITMIVYLFIPLWFLQCFNCCSSHASDNVYVLQSFRDFMLRE